MFEYKQKINLLPLLLEALINHKNVTKNWVKRYRMKLLNCIGQMSTVLIFNITKLRDTHELLLLNIILTDAYCNNNNPSILLSNILWYWISECNITVDKLLIFYEFYYMLLQLKINSINIDLGYFTGDFTGEFCNSWFVLHI